MEQVKSILQKLESLSTSASVLSTIERDLLLQYTRDLYEVLLQIKTSSVTTNEGKPTENEIGQTEESAPTIMPDEQVGGEKNEETKFESEDIETEKEHSGLKEVEQEDKNDVYSFEEEISDDEENVEENDFIFEDISLEEEILSDLETSTEESERINFVLDIEKEETPITSAQKSMSDFKLWSKDIRSYIGINDKYNFISELFGNNPEAYDEILNELNICESKEEAHQFLENSGITTLYGWKEDGFSEQIFYNILNQFFASK
ncbi:MAG: hypothetical protein V4561_03495 [Bacteroidota bacterium]